MLVRVAACPIDAGALYLLRDAEPPHAWFFYAPCCGVALRSPPRGFGDLEGLLPPLAIRTPMIPSDADTTSSPWAACPREIDPKQVSWVIERACRDLEARSAER